jgi:hypothetical protein
MRYKLNSKKCSKFLQNIFPINKIKNKPNIKDVLKNIFIIQHALNFLCYALLSKERFSFLSCNSMVTSHALRMISSFLYSVT